MSNLEIALFADKNSPQILEIAEAVRLKGGKPLVFDIQLGGPGRPTMTMCQEALFWEGIDFSEIKVAHIRCTSLNTFPALPPMMNQTMYAELRLKFIREQEFQSSVYGFFAEYEDRGGLVINSLTGGYVDHDTKCQLYEKLRGKGFSVPASLSTNNSLAAQEFAKSYEQIVFKPMVGVGSTRTISQEELRDIDTFSCPILFQERIPGDILRIHIVGDKVVIALKIISDGVDSRTATKRFEFVEIPESEQASLVAAHRFLGLHYSAWDIVAGSDGRYVYLDCNSGPYVMWIGEKFRGHVFEQLANYMVTYARTGSISESSASVIPFSA